MAGLIPFNRKNNDLINSGFDVEDRKKFENKIKVYLNRMN